MALKAGRERMIIEAHRGDRENAPENTMTSFRRALALGVPWIELDVHPAADGTLVVIHDDTVDRTTNGAGAVGEMTVQDLLRLDAGAGFDPEFAGERIPLLTDVMELLAATRTLLNVEIKRNPHGQHVAETVAALLRRFGREREYIVSSFDLDALLQVRAVAPEIALALIGSGREIHFEARRYLLPWIHGRWDTVDEGLIAAAHEDGIRVNVWTVDDPARLGYWCEVGADKLCTNRPAAMLAAAKRAGDG